MRACKSKLCILCFSLMWGFSLVGIENRRTSCEWSVEAGRHSGNQPCFHPTSVSASCLHTHFPLVPSLLLRIHPPPVYTVMDQSGGGPGSYCQQTSSKTLPCLLKNLFSPHLTSCQTGLDGFLCDRERMILTNYDRV